MVSLYPESCTTDTVEQLMDQEVILAGHSSPQQSLMVGYMPT